VVVVETVPAVSVDVAEVSVDDWADVSVSAEMVVVCVVSVVMVAVSVATVSVTTVSVDSASSFLQETAATRATAQRMVTNFFIGSSPQFNIGDSEAVLRILLVPYHPAFAFELKPGGAR
jgi:hypothetical protein